MFNRKVLITLALLTAAFGITMNAFGQTTAPLRGKVELKKADGSVVPVVGALVELFRTDAKGKLPSTKTDKKGGFVFAGIMFGQTFALSISAPGIAPEVFPGIKAGRDDVTITVYEGDGKVLTEDEVRKAAASGKSDGPAADAEALKKANADRQKQIDEYNKNKKKADDDNAMVAKLYGEGNNAFKANDFETAIAKYSEGIAIDETHPAVPQFLTNRSLALTKRGVERYNSSIKATDDALKSSSLESAKKDWLDAAVDANKSYGMYIKAGPPTDPAELANYKSNKYLALTTRAESMRFVATKVDPSRMSEMATAYKELMADETDVAKKAQTHKTYAKALMDGGDFENAIVEFEKILEAEPGNVDALAGVGLSLVSVGYTTNDKEKFQEGANYLAKYVDLAPAGHIFKQDIVATLDSLKKEQNITGQKGKVTTTKKRP